MEFPSYGKCQYFNIYFCPILKQKVKTQTLATHDVQKNSSRNVKKHFGWDQADVNLLPLEL